MDQSKLEEIMEFLKASQYKIEAVMKATQHEIDAHHEEMIAKMDAWRGVTPARLEEEEPAPEEPKAVAETEEVPEGATDEEAIGVTEGQSRNLRLAVRCCGRLKTRTKCDGRVRQDCAATVGRPTCRFVPALCKGGLHRGPGKKCRLSGIKGLGKTSGSRMEGRSLKQRRPEYNVVRGTAKGKTCEERRRTRPECNSGIRRLSTTSGNGKRGRIVKSDQRLEAKRTHHEAIRKSLFMEITKLIFESSIGLRELGDCLLWKCRPPPKRKR
jgi:hypothetical protein